MPLPGEFGRELTPRQRSLVNLLNGAQDDKGHKTDPGAPMAAAHPTSSMKINLLRKVRESKLGVKYGMSGHAQVSFAAADIALLVDCADRYSQLLKSMVDEDYDRLEALVAENRAHAHNFVWGG